MLSTLVTPMLVISRVLAFWPRRAELWPIALSLGSHRMEGLVIDDYFAIAKVPRGLLVADPAKGCLSTSKAVYSKHGIIGSDDKDIKGERRAKVIGAYVNASDQAQDRGHVLISAPPAKRYALAWVSFQLCQLTHTTDALHLCVLGGWTSIPHV